MAPATNDEQFKFLISCVRYSNNGKIDFVKVADECDVVSKGAAAKRYERMMRAHGISSSSSITSSKSTSTPRTKTETRRSSIHNASNPTNKKRKVNHVHEDDMEGGDDEEEGYGGNLKIKTESTKSGLNIKQESGSGSDMTGSVRVDMRRSTGVGMGMNDATDLLRYYDANTDAREMGGETFYGMAASKSHRSQGFSSPRMIDSTGYTLQSQPRSRYNHSGAARSFYEPLNYGGGSTAYGSGNGYTTGSASITSAYGNGPVASTQEKAATNQANSTSLESVLQYGSEDRGRRADSPLIVD